MLADLNWQILYILPELKYLEGVQNCTLIFKTLLQISGRKRKNQSLKITRNKGTKIYYIDHKLFLYD